MTVPTAPFSSTDFPDNYFSGLSKITQHDGGPSPKLPAILRDIFDRIMLKNGRVTISAAATTSAVTFTTAYADTNYSISAIAREITVGIANVNVFITNKATTGFTINISAAPGGANSIGVDWIAIHD